jgi:hypothetical protein
MSEETISNMLQTTERYKTKSIPDGLLRLSLEHLVKGDSPA